MRLSRTLLVLAAGLAAPLPAANVTVDADRTINSLSELTGNNFAIGNDAVLTIDLRNSLDAPIDGTFSGWFQDGFYDANGNLNAGLDRSGILRKTGGGTLQYSGFADMKYLKNASFDTLLNSPLPEDLRQKQDAEVIDRGANQGFAGILVVEQGQLQVAGHINQWANYGDFGAALGGTGQMHGTVATVVEGGAKLSFRNTSLNIVGASAALGDTAHGNPGTPLVARLNYLNNPLAATAARIETGPDDEYILVLHADVAPLVGVTEATVGILEGKGRVYKTGASDLRITNNASFDGEFVSAGGRLILAAGSGDTLWSAKSVNLASGGQGTNVAFNADIHWKPQYAPAAEDSTTLVVQGAQRIRNFQSLYSDGGFTAMVSPSTGAGNFVELGAATDVLTIQQETGYDGYFRGAFVGAGLDPVTLKPTRALGTLRKTGDGNLALFSTANNLSRVEVLDGKLISNVESLGDGEVYIGAAGELSIVQNRSGALRAVIRTEVTDTTAELRFKPADSIQYRGGDPTALGDDDFGLSDIVATQEYFYGRVIVEDGNAIIFSAGNNNAFLNASAVVLSEGAEARKTSIRFNDTSQIVNNLEGDAATYIALGRGDITLVTTETATAAALGYAGTISGVGNLIKRGARTFSLSGANSYFGATVVSQGALDAVTSAIGNTSGLVTRAGTSFTGTGTQSVGALFGQAGSTVTVSGALTVGVSDELRVRLVTELASLPGTVPPNSAAYYLATEAEAVLPGFTFTPATTLGFIVRQYELAADADLDGVVSEDEVAAYLDADGSGSTTLADLSAADLAANASLLAFSGTLSVGGALTKVGVERLSLRGAVNFTGSDRSVSINQGTLEASFGTLAGASSISLAAAGAYELIVTEDATLVTPLSGSGTFIKAGTGRLDLDSAAASFTGAYRVNAGILAVTFAPTVTGGSTTAQGDVDLRNDAAFVAKVSANLTWSGSAFGEGSFAKSGAGVLTLAGGRIFHAGPTDIQEGGLVVSAMPVGDLALAAGTTFVDDVADNPLTDVDDYYDGNITGTGSLTKTGAGDLRIENAQAFEGRLIVSAGSLTLVSANAFTAAQVELQDGANLILLNGADQSLGAITATSGSSVTVDVAGTNLTLDAPTGTNLTFSGRILGGAALIKSGPGKYSLARPDVAPNALASIEVRAGELEGSQSALGGADIDISAGATLRFSAAEGAAETYAGLVITGAGAIAKSGAGTVDLSGSSLTAVDTAIDVAAGTLLLSETALGAGRAPRVTLSNGATVEYLATNDAGFSIANFSGTGSVAFGRTAADTPIITLTPGLSGAPGYTGQTIVRTGVTLVLGDGFTNVGGLDIEADATLDLSDLSALTINQAADGAFVGNLIGDADLTVAGTKRLSVESAAGTLDGYFGSVTVSGATLALDLANTKSITLASGGTLSLRGAADNYTGALAGSGNVVLEDGADVDLTAGTNATTTTLGSAAVSRLSLAPGSHLTASFTAGQPLAGKSIQLDGGLLTATGEGSITLSLAAAATTPGVPTGPAGLELLGDADYTLSGSIVGDLSVGTNATATYAGSALAGDLNIASDGDLRLGAVGSPVAIAGDLDVSVGGTLRGAWSLAGTLTNSGTVAPGFSPAHVTATDIDNSGTLVMEVNATTEDQIAFTGSAILNRNNTGVLLVNRDGTATSYGVRHVIFKDTVSPGAGSYTVSAPGEDPRFSAVRSVGTSATAVRHLLVYPTQLQGGPDGILGNADDDQDKLRSLAVGRDGEIAVYEVRAASEYESFTGPTQIIDWLKVITEVTLDESDPATNKARASALGAGFSALGARFATLNDAQLAQAVGNLGTKGQFSLATVALGGVRTDQDTVHRRLEQRRFDKADTSVKNDEWYVDAVGGRVTVDNGPSASLAGATAGFIRDVGFDGYYGASLGIDKSKGSNGQASVDTSGFRLGVFGGALTDDRAFALDAGLSFASLGGDLARPSAFGSSNVGEVKATTAAGWIRVSTAAGFNDGWALTPHAQFEASTTNLSGLSEKGEADALSVTDATLSESSLSLGVGIQKSWTEGRGGWRYRLSLNLGYTAQLSGDTLSLTSHIQSENLAPYATEQRVLPGSGLMLAPTFTFGPDPDSTYTVGLRFDQASEGNAVTGQIGYRKRF